MFNILSLAIVAITAISSFAAPADENVRRQAIGQPITGGSATFYFQNGIPGACGGVNPDNAAIVAEQALRYKASDCGRKVRITNIQNGKTVDAVVADRCATCQGNANSLDLSVFAFNQIATEAQGIVPITWEYLS
ncbi:hypothetical protein PENSPDRAFT_750619 [Peniophora sp. CONT]|nr:hypothetical protein PENSPDRAFT_750619 [Peniophora sp. CONT]